MSKPRAIVPLLVLLAVALMTNVRALSQGSQAATGPAGLLRAPVFRNLGPARQNGRVLHLMVDERKPSTFYIVPSTGGLWKTTNNATTFESVLPDKSVVSIGHAALAPSNPDIVWAGAGDGKVQVTRDGGGTWTDRTAKLASAGGNPDFYVTRVFASPHKEGTAFVTKAGWHRDVYAPFVFRTDDYGETWTNLSAGLPDATVNSFAQDRRNADLLFPGTEMGVFATLDGAGAAGLQTVDWDFRRTDAAAPAATAAAAQGAPRQGGRAPARLASPGEYVVVLEIGTKTWMTRAVVRPAPER